MVESTAKPLFRELIHLYQMALMIEELDEKSKAWIDPAMEYMASVFSESVEFEKPLSIYTIENLMGWNYS